MKKKRIVVCIPSGYSIYARSDGDIYTSPYEAKLFEQGQINLSTERLVAGKRTKTRHSPSEYTFRGLYVEWFAPLSFPSYLFGRIFAPRLAGER